MYSKRLDCSSLFRFCEEGKYWSITSEGKTFVFGDLTFPENWPFEAWRVRDGDMLCAFVAGEMTVGELRKHAYLAEREAKKELRREEHIRNVAQQLRHVYRLLQEAKERASSAEIKRWLCNRYRKDSMEALLKGPLPFTSKKTIRRILSDGQPEL